jgi:hypothetical protein
MNFFMALVTDSHPRGFIQEEARPAFAMVAVGASSFALFPIFMNDLAPRMQNHEGFPFLSVFKIEGMSLGCYTWSSAYACAFHLSKDSPSPDTQGAWVSECVRITANLQVGD